MSDIIKLQCILPINNFKLLVIVDVILLIVSFVIPNIVYAENIKDEFKISDEMLLSSPQMNCNYSWENPTKTYFNFEYPKLIIKKNGELIVAFIDEVEKILIFCDINELSSDLKKVLPRHGDGPYDGWPIIFTQGDDIYLTQINNIILNKTKKYSYEVKINLWDDKDNKATFIKDISLSADIINELHEKFGHLSGIYPYDVELNNFLIVGGFEVSHFHPGAIFSGEFPTFDKNFSITLKNNEIGLFKTIEEKGWFSALRRAYEISESGTMHAAWIRDTSRIGLSTKHDEAVYYSQNKDGKDWTKPLELYSVMQTETKYHIKDLSIATYGKKVFLMWVDSENGCFFREIADGIPLETIKISSTGLTHDSTKVFLEPLFGLSMLKIAVDKIGNIYTLWVENSGVEYRIMLRSLISDKWTQTIVVKSGRGTVKLPDMKVDGKGNVHVTYIKGLKVGDKFGCYYIKLSPTGTTWGQP